MSENKIFKASLGLLIVMQFMVGSLTSVAMAGPAQAPFRAGEIIVQFRPGTAPQIDSSMLSSSTPSISGQGLVPRPQPERLKPARAFEATRPAFRTARGAAPGSQGVGGVRHCAQPNQGRCFRRRQLVDSGKSLAAATGPQGQA